MKSYYTYLLQLRLTIDLQSTILLNWLLLVYTTPLVLLSWSVYTSSSFFQSTSMTLKPSSSLRHPSFHPFLLFWMPVLLVIETSRKKKHSRRWESGIRARAGEPSGSGYQIVTNSCQIHEASLESSVKHQKEETKNSNRAYVKGVTV